MKYYEWDEPGFFLDYSKHQLADIILQWERLTYLERMNGEPFTLKEGPHDSDRK